MYECVNDNPPLSVLSLFLSFFVLVFHCSRCCVYFPLVVILFFRYLRASILKLTAEYDVEEETDVAAVARQWFLRWLKGEDE